MKALRESLNAHARSLQSLLTALDLSADGESLSRLNAIASASFDVVRVALTQCSAAECKALEPELANLRRWTALADDASRRTRAQVSERLGDLNRARQVQAQLDSRSTGEACNIAG